METSGFSDPSPTAAERRHLTVLFADLVGFTSLSEKVGEEGAYAVGKMVYDLTTRAVESQGGAIAHFAGDGVMALFGAAGAQEDAPLRACRAALSIHEEVAAIATDFETRHGVRPQMRVGVSSGLAVVTRIGANQSASTALGDTVNLAARLQTVAEPGTTVLGEATLRLVESFVRATFVGEHMLKGKSEAQKAYRLDSIRAGATRFDAAIQRGLSSFVGRQHEIDTLENGFESARKGLRVYDISAEPGLGKSRIVHELRQRAARRDLQLSTAHCTPDSAATPLALFADLVRDWFRIGAEEPAATAATKLEQGLRSLYLLTQLNLGLILNLFALPAPEGALEDCDAILIGRRTRELLREMVEARCRTEPSLLLIEDVHWIDSVSEQLLADIIDSGEGLPLMVVTTRRPEYTPPWLKSWQVVRLPLKPLGEADIRTLIRDRLGAEAVSSDLARLVIDKADGNALFAEEIINYIIETHATADTLDSSKGSVQLPASIQGVFAARVARLPQPDRALMRAAAVIGRTFEVDLLAVVVDRPRDLDARLAALEKAGFLQRTDEPGEMMFKHALLRDALLQGLLREPRANLHQRIAEEIERRRGNRIADVLELLAQHYGQSDRRDKAFEYGWKAAVKSVGSYCLGEAETLFSETLALLESTPNCASDEKVAEFMADYGAFLVMTLKLTDMVRTFEAQAERVYRSGDNDHRVLALHHYTLALAWTGNYPEARVAMDRLSEFAKRRHTVQADAYHLASLIHISTMVGPMPIEEFEAVSARAVKAASAIDDLQLNYFVRYAIAWDEMHRGRSDRATQLADELLALGEARNDARSTGYGLLLRCWMALTSDDYQAAYQYASSAVEIARTPFEREGSALVKIAAALMLERKGAIAEMQQFLERCEANGWDLPAKGGRLFLAVAEVKAGDIAKGIRDLESLIVQIEKEGYETMAAWHRLFLAEVYVIIVSEGEKPPISVILRNLPTLMRVMLTARWQVPKLLAQTRKVAHYYDEGHHGARADMNLGLLAKALGRRSDAVRYLMQAKTTAGRYGRTPMLARIETALVGLAA